MERKLLNKKQAKKQANGKQLNAEDAARLAYLKAKNKAAKAAAAANNASDSSEEIVFDHGGSSNSDSSSSSSSRVSTRGPEDSALSHAHSHSVSATRNAANEAKAQLNARGQQLNGLSDKTADLANAAGEFEAMCKELRRKS